MTDQQMDPELTKDTGLPPDVSADEFKDRVEQQSAETEHGWTTDDSEAEDASGVSLGPENEG